MASTPASGAIAPTDPRYQQRYEDDDQQRALKPGALCLIRPARPDPTICCPDPTLRFPRGDTAGVGNNPSNLRAADRVCIE